LNKGLKQFLVATLALAMTIPSVAVPESQAATKKPVLNKTSVSIKVGKTQKLTVKNVKAKKIKKTTWSIKKSSIATLTKKTKTSVTIRAKKAGTTKVTASVKVGSKTYKKTCTVKVTGNAVVTKSPAATDAPEATNTPAAETEAPTATPEPTLRPLDTSYKNLASIPAQDSDSFATTPPDATVNPATKVGYSADFEDVAIGTKTVDTLTTDENTKEIIVSNGIQGVILRGHAKAEDGGAGTYNDYLEVVDGSELPVEGNDTHVLRCYRQVKTWQGPMMNLTDNLEAGCTYILKADVMSPTSDLQCSYQLQTSKSLSAGYGNFTNSSGATQKIAQGKWNTVEFTISVPDDKYYYGLYFESYNGVGNDDIYLDNVTLTKTVQTTPTKSIASLKDTYQDVFGIVGVGAGLDSIIGNNGSEFISDQFNAYTPGNEMKPDAIIGSTPGKIVSPDDEMSDNTDFLTIEDAKKAGYYIPDDYTSYEDNQYKNEYAVPRLNFTKVDAIMKACHDKGIKLRGHTLVWHQQTPVLFFQKNYKATVNSKTKNYNVSKECMNSRLEFYIKTVLKHVLSSEYADCLYAYDVVNEYLHSTDMTTGKPTYWGTIYGTLDDSTTNSGVSLRPEYVKAAFKYANEMLVEYNRTDVKLFYNDYNCYQYPEDIVHLIDYINEDGKVCDGLGMQSHLDVTSAFHSADSFAKALECFRLNMPDEEIQITELDATMSGTTENPVTDEDQAVYYDQIMNAILTNKKNGGNITGLILWSLYDGVSWRAAKTPCVFKGLYEPKAAFYAMLDAKTKYYQ
jgi:endo-1,4-beta-xylanase